MTGAKNHKELIVWQVADELRKEVYGLTGRSGRSCAISSSRISCAMPSAEFHPTSPRDSGGSSSTDNARFITYALNGHGRNAGSTRRRRQARTLGERGTHERESSASVGLTKGLRNYQSYLLSEEGTNAGGYSYEAYPRPRDARTRRTSTNPTNPTNLLSSRLARFGGRIPHIRDPERGTRERMYPDRLRGALMAAHARVVAERLDGLECLV